MSPLRLAARRCLITLVVFAAWGDGVSRAQTATVADTWVKKGPWVLGGQEGVTPQTPFGGYLPSMAYDSVTGTVVDNGGRLESDANEYYDTSTWLWNGTNWRLSPAQGPGSSGESMAGDPVRGNVVLFDPTYIWNGLANTWTLGTAARATVPKSRSEASMAWDPATQVTVLCCGEITQSSTGNDTWTWNGSAWNQVTTSPIPSFRTAATLALDVNGNLVLYGGSQSVPLHTSYDNSTWLWNGSVWASTTVAAPAQRYGAVSAYLPARGKTVLFGGISANTGNTQTAYGDTWLWDGAAWSQVFLNTYNGSMWSAEQLPAPPAAASGDMAYDGATGNLVYFGGYNTTPSNPNYGTNGFFIGSYGDTWTYGPGPFTPVDGNGQATTTPVGTAAPITVYFNLTSTGALGTTQVLTQGAANSDFTLATGGSCITGAPLGVCSVNVTFTPSVPGMRTGAVSLTDANNKVIATALVSGTGTGPQATFSPGVISTVVGSGVQCADSTLMPPCGDGGAATSATLFAPVAVAVDGAGNLFVVDEGDLLVRKIDTTGKITTVAGNGTSCAVAGCGDGGAATSATFVAPNGLAIDGAGNLYISDGGTNSVREVVAATGIINTIAGNGTACSSASATLTTGACGDLGQATAAELNSPLGIALDSAGNLYIADTADNRIREVAVANGVIRSVVGTGYGCANPRSTTGACGDGGQGSAATVSNPYGVRLDAAGNLFIADAADERIRKVTANTGVISTVAGNGNPCATSGCGDGALATDPSVAITTPAAIAVDAAGDVYIAAAGENSIRKVSAATGLISTIVGNGTACATTDTTGCGDGTAANSATAELYQPIDVTMDGAGNLFIADFFDNRVRKVSTVASIAFPTATTAGTADVTDGTMTAMLNNIGSAPLTISQASSTNDFVLGNPMSGGCSTSVAAGGSCLIGATFTPQASDASSAVTGSIVTTDNSLNATGATQATPLSGTTIPLLANTINFPQPMTPVIAGGTGTLMATSTSGNIVYSVTQGAATITGSTITYANSGTVQITANSPTDGTYAPAAPVSVSVVVNALPSTFTWMPSTQQIYTGAVLDSTILDATDSVSATVTYAAYLSSASASTAVPVSAGTMLSQGSYMLVATATPQSSYYATQSITLPFTVQNMNVFVVGSGKTMSFYNNGSAQSAATSGGGTGAVVDSAGSVWSINADGMSLSKFNDAGVFVANYSPTGIASASALAIDGSSNLWIANGNGTISLISNAGMPLATITGSTTAAPSGIAIDLSGDVWVANPTTSTVDEIVGGAAPVAPLATGVTTATPGTRP